MSNLVTVASQPIGQVRPFFSGGYTTTVTRLAARIPQRPIDNELCSLQPGQLLEQPARVGPNIIGGNPGQGITIALLDDHPVIVVVARPMPQKRGLSLVDRWWRARFIEDLKCFSGALQRESYRIQNLPFFDMLNQVVNL